MTGTWVILAHAFSRLLSSLNFYIKGVMEEENYPTNSANNMNILGLVGAGNGSPFYGRVRQVKHLPYNTDITTL